MSITDDLIEKGLTRPATVNKARSGGFLQFLNDYGQALLFVIFFVSATAYVVIGRSHGV